jgi:multisubunit Na+/H+ antiporter MnhF subunit
VSFDPLFVFFLVCFIGGISIAAFVDKYGDK